MCCINAVLALERRPNNAYMHWPFSPAAVLQLDILSFCASFKLDPEAFVYVAVCFVCTSPACVGVTNMILYFQGLQCQHRWMAVTKVRCLLDTSGRYCILFFHNFPLQRLQPRHCFLTPNFFTQPKTKMSFSPFTAAHPLSVWVYFELKFEANGSVMQQKIGLSFARIAFTKGSLMNSLFPAQCVVIRTASPPPPGLRR